MDKEKIGKLLDELADDVVNRVSELRGLLEVRDTEKQGLELERENFRVDSTNWKQSTNEQGMIFLENPKKDIWEYVDGVSDELVGQQLFTWKAAMRETKKAGKRMPTDEEFFQFRKEDFGKIVYAGYRNTNGAFTNSGTYTYFTYFWSSSVSGANAWKRHLYSSHSPVYRNPYDQAHGFSVRCLKN